MHIVSLFCDAISTACLGPYGAEWIETPNLNRLACEGVVFDHCYCPYRGTQARDLGNALEQLGHDGTSAGVSVLRVRESDYHGEHSLQAALSSASQAMANPNRRTQNTVLWIDLKLRDAGWQPSAGLLERHLEDRSPVDAIGSLVGWLDKDVTEDQIDALRDTYAARIEELDRCLGTFFERLRDAGLYDDVVIVFTSREGWPLGEHGMIGPAAPWAHEERDHVPLIIKYPGCREGTRRSHLTTTLDLVPTTASILGLDRVAPLEEGVHVGNRADSLLRLLQGDAADWRDAVLTGFDGVEVALRTNDWKLILPLGAAVESRSRMLFRKPSDRWEFNDLVGIHPEVADELERRIPSHIR